MSTSVRPEDAAGGGAPGALAGEAEAAASPQDDARKEEQAKKICKHMGFNTFVLMSVFTQRIDMFMSLAQFEGDITKVAVRNGFLTALGSCVELFANPFLGKLSDTIGRWPLMVLSPVANLIFKLNVFLNPTQFAMELDKVLGTTLSVVGGTTMVSASMADVFAGNPARQATANISAQMFAAIGIIAGPLYGVAVSKGFGGPRSAYLGSALMSIFHLSLVARMQESLAPELRKPFSAAGANPLSFLKLLGECRQLRTLAFLGGVMQNIPEGKNLADIHQTFSVSDVGMTEAARGSFISFFGFCQLVGAILAKKLTGAMGGQSFTSLCTFSISASMLWYSIVPPAIRQSWPMFVGAAMQLFVSASPGYTKAVAAEYAKKAGWGMGEFQGAMANMRAVTSATVPLLLATVYAWSKRNGRSRPGLAYQLVAACGILTELLFRTLSARDLAIKG